MKKALKIFGRVLLALIVLVMVSAVVLFFCVKSGMAKAEPLIDDAPALAAEEPMSAGERFSVSDSGQIGVRIDKRDIWWYLLDVYGADLTDVINEQFSAFGMEFQGCGIDISSADGIRIDGKASFKGTPLAGSVFCDCRYDGEAVTIRPRKIELGGLNLSADLVAEIVKIDLNEFCFEFFPQTFFLKGIESVEADDGALVFSGEISEAIVEKIKSPSARARSRDAFFMEEYRYVFPVFEAIDEGTEVYAGVIPVLADDPSAFPNFAYELMTVADKMYLLEKKPETLNRYFLSRWMPDYSSPADAEKAIAEKYKDCSHRLDVTAKTLSEAYSRHEIQLDENGFVYNDVPFSFKDFFESEEDEFLECIDDSNAFLALIDHSGVKDSDAPGMITVIKGEWPFGDSLDIGMKYPIGIVALNFEGRPYILYKSTSNTVAQGEVVKTVYVNVTPLTDAEYEDMLNTDAVPVWR